MFTLGAVGFLNPWLLAGLIALPVLWWLLRAIPPSPKILTFPGVRLLLGLEDPERQAAKTPWWLLLLRCLALAAVIVGFAGPVLNPNTRLAPAGLGPVLILMDQGWASAPDWAARKAAALAAVDEAAQNRRQAEQFLAELAEYWPVKDGEDRAAALERRFAEWLKTERARTVAWKPLRPVKATSNLPRWRWSSRGSSSRCERGLTPGGLRLRNGDTCRAASCHFATERANGTWPFTVGRMP